MSPRKLTALASFAALAFALCLAGTKPALAATDCITEDLTGEIFTNACNATTVTITKGTRKTCAQIVDDGNGGQHAHVTIVVHGKADGSDGNNYVINATLHETLNLNSGGAANQTDTIHINFIGHGQAPNFRCKVTAHITVNANGTITADFEKFTADCVCLL